MPIQRIHVALHGLGTVSTVIGTVGDLVVHDNAISVGGSYASIKGKIIKP
jgi:hypothetical protein